MADFRPFSDEKLDQWIASGCSSHEREQAIVERERRHAVISLQQSAQSHQELIAEQQRLRSAVDSLTTGQSAVKQSVDRLAKPHRIVKWGLVVAILAALFAGIAALDVLIRWFGGK
jgi:hypothetical protein